VLDVRREITKRFGLIAHLKISLIRQLEAEKAARDDVIDAVLLRVVSAADSRSHILTDTQLDNSGSHRAYGFAPVPLQLFDFNELLLKDNTPCPEQTNAGRILTGIDHAHCCSIDSKTVHAIAVLG